MNQINSKPCSIGEMFIEVIKLYGKSWLKLLPLVFFIALLLLAAQYIMQPAMNVGKPAIEVVKLLAKKRLITVGIIELCAICLIFALYHRCYQIVTAHEQGNLYAIKVAIKNFVWCVAVNILYVIIVLLGLFVLIIPGIFFAFLFYFCTVAIIVDGKGVFGSLVYSVKLVWGNWWRTFLIFFVFGVLIVTFMIISSIFVIMPLNLIFHLNVSQLTIINNIVMFIILAIILPFWSSMLVRLYYDLKLRRERFIEPTKRL